MVVVNLITDTLSSPNMYCNAYLWITNFSSPCISRWLMFYYMNVKRIFLTSHKTVSISFLLDRLLKYENVPLSSSGGNNIYFTI